MTNSEKLRKFAQTLFIINLILSVVAIITGIIMLVSGGSLYLSFISSGIVLIIFSWGFKMIANVIADIEKYTRKKN